MCPFGVSATSCPGPPGLRFSRHFGVSCHVGVRFQDGGRSPQRLTLVLGHSPAAGGKWDWAGLERAGAGHRRSYPGCRAALSWGQTLASGVAGAKGYEGSPHSAVREPVMITRKSSVNRRGDGGLACRCAEQSENRTSVPTWTARAHTHLPRRGPQHGGFAVREVRWRTRVCEQPRGAGLRTGHGRCPLTGVRLGRASPWLRVHRGGAVPVTKHRRVSVTGKLTLGSAYMVFLNAVRTEGSRAESPSPAGRTVSVHYVCDTQVHV